MIIYLSYLFIISPEEAPDSSGTKLSQPIDIRKLKIGMEHYKDSLDDEIPKPQPKLTRGFSEAARPPTPPNASHLVRSIYVMNNI